jgi:5-methylcytosine-specific restriction endonuclease McrA
MDYFGYGIQDFIPCECCENRCVDVHHILTRKKRPDLINDINNLMGLCRKCHEDYGDREPFLEYLQKIHNLRLGVITN